VIKRAFGIFITPDSNSLVFLAEDSKRTFRLDWLEMLHYRAVLHTDVLHDSFAPNGEKFRYGNSCRDVSIPLPQYKLSIFSGIATKEILETFTDSGPRCAVFHLSPKTGAITPVAVEVTGVREHKGKAWTFRIDEAVLNAMRGYREEHLPRETGGVLVGNFDTYRRVCSVVTAMPSPPDSEEWPTCYIRGVSGLKAAISECELLTGGQVGYVGEWHSHPNFCSVRPSDDDRAAHRQLSHIMNKEALPGLIVIVGDKNAVSVMV
jgi:integrative and conjugative element protein (TIGR02256 family)